MSVYFAFNLDVVIYTCQDEGQEFKFYIVIFHPNAWGARKGGYLCLSNR
jgi:hypothetical protein